MLAWMSFRRRLRALALLGFIAVAAIPTFALAQATAADIAGARKHFERARAFYGQGAYREAVGELEAAHSLDPGAKDLVFNLGVVHEKLSDIDEALKWFKLYTTMDLVPVERDRAEAYIKRLEGAKREVEAAQAAPPPPPAEPPPPAPEPASQVPVASPPPAGPGLVKPGAFQPLPEPPPRTTGRVDGLVAGGAGLTAAALAFGSYMAVTAKRTQPPATYVTGRDGSFSDLTQSLHTAHTEAVWADVGFGTALAAGLATTYLYFARSRPAVSTSARSTTVSAQPLSGGGTLVLKGTF
jgi:hypothetical protein